jgi:hypothetical protein
MNEQKRQAYLQAMDIQTYYPRRQLPGAKPSPHYDFPELGVAAPHSTGQTLEALEAKPNVVVPKKPSASTKRHGLKAIEELRAATSSARRAPDTAIRAESTVSAADAAEDKSVEQSELSFTLRYYRINEKLAVIDEVPTLGSRQQSEQSHVLLLAILKALGQEDSALSQNPDEFSWPLQGGYSMKNPAEVEAAKAIAGFLQMRQETDGFLNLLVFAGQVETVLLSADENKSARDFESSKGYFVTVTHSLASMLAVPTLKRDVWQHLQALRKRIDAAS